MMTNAIGGAAGMTWLPLHAWAGLCASFSLRRNDTLVLCYHRVGEMAAGAFVTSEKLDGQLRLLVARGYRTAGFSDAVLGPRRGRVLAVTFDDGHESVVGEALPVLTRHGLVGTVFPRLDEIGRTGFVTLTELQLLATAGWEIGSHTLSHQDLTTLSDSDLERELTGSKRELERLVGLPCRSIAYPFGRANARVLAATAAAGYEVGGALLGVSSGVGQLAWPRVGVDGLEGRFRFRIRTSRTFRALRGTGVGSRLVRMLAGLRAGEAQAQRLQR